MNRPAIFAYSVNHLIDLDNAVVINVEANRSIRLAEIGATRAMVDRTKDIFDLQPERLAADTAYGYGDKLGWPDDCQVTPHIPVFDKTDRTDGAFPNTAFSFDPEADEYTCPGCNKLLPYWWTMSKPRTGTRAAGLGDVTPARKTAEPVR